MKYYYGKRSKRSGSFEIAINVKSSRAMNQATSISNGKGEFVDIFEEQKDGKFKCLLCNTYTIPRRYKNNYVYYNLEDGAAHRQKTWSIKRRKHQYLCCVPDSKKIEEKRRIRRLKVKHDKNNFLWVEPE